MHPGVNGATVNVSPHYRQSLKPFEGFIWLDTRNRDDTGLGYMDSWQVRIALPQDIETAETWLDDHADQLLAAVALEAIPLSLAPATLALDATTVPGVLIKAAREG